MSTSSGYGAIPSDDAPEAAEAVSVQLVAELRSAQPEVKRRPACTSRRLVLAGGLMTALGVACGGGALLYRHRARTLEAVKGRWSTDTYSVSYQELKQPEVRRSVDGVLETTFNIVPTHVHDGPVSYMTRTYEGTVPGPTLMVKPGDTLKITQVNHLQSETAGLRLYEHALHLPNTTTIHTHGLHISPSGIADNIFRTLASGERTDSVYHIRPDHQTGTFYYHPHYHGSSTVQMAGGMSGALIVEDEEGSLPEELAKARDLLMVLQHVNVQLGTFKNFVWESRVMHSLLNPRVSYSYKGAPGNYFIVNGQYQPAVTVRPGELVRLRLLNAGINDYLLVQVPGCQLWEIAADGVYYSKPRPKSLVTLVVGSRKDVLVRCAAAGLYTAASSRPDLHIQQYFGNGTDVFEGTLWHMRVTGEPVSSTLPTWLPAPDPKKMPQFEGLVRTERPVNAFDYEFYTAAHKADRGGLLYNVYGVNRATKPITEVQRRVSLGDVEEWRITSYRGDGTVEVTNHPFHIHVNHFQIVSMSHGAGVDFEVGDWRDSISQPLSPQGGSFVTVRWKADDYTGMAPAHCHVFSHSDTGMSLTFEIVDKGQA